MNTDDLTAIGAATDGPAADPIADLCKRLRKWYDKERGCVWEAADALERLARENAIVQRGRMDLRAELSGERDRHKRTQERAERAEAERDALRKCLKSVVSAWDDDDKPTWYERWQPAIDAARAKVNTTEGEK